MEWPDDPTVEQANAADNARELTREIHRAELTLVGLCALFLGVIGVVVYVVFFQSSAPIRASCAWMSPA